MKLRIDIIVPVFNTPVKYLKVCVESIFENIYSDNCFCTIIDDKTTDLETLEYLKKLEGRQNTKVIRHEVNKGLSEARNTGIKQTNGDIIWFVDSDDVVKKSSIKTIMDAFEANEGLEIFAFQSDRCDKEGICFVETSTIVKFNTPKPVDMEHFLNASLDAVPVWRKAYSRKFFNDNNIWFNDKNLFFEDLYFFILTYSRAKKMLFSPRLLYSYRDTSSGMMRTTNKLKKASDSLIQVRDAWNKIKKDNTFMSRHFDDFAQIFIYRWFKVISFTEQEKKSFDYLYVLHAADKLNNEIVEYIKENK